MTDYVIASSKELHDVKKASLKDLNFTSQKNLFKIQQHGTWSMTLYYSYYYNSIYGYYYHKWEGQTSITHNLDFAPTFEVWGRVEDWGENNYQKWTYYYYATASGPKYRIIESNSSNITIKYLEQLRENLYNPQYGHPLQNVTIDGIYSIYVDPIL
ncbi:MAG TPA: hypothetical protein PKN66_10345 [Thermodesulfovibrio thiophilus]|nr:hypothetical protein [Thermodesulfovibrio thiophilus]